MKRRQHSSHGEWLAWEEPRAVGDLALVEKFFARNLGINYAPSPKPKSDLYRDMLPLLNSRRLELLDNMRLILQLTSLERRTARFSRDSIDHAPGAHDDIANCVAGVLTAVATPQQRLRMFTYDQLGTGMLSVELDPRTGRPLNERECTRVKWTTVPEAAVPAIKGYN